MMECKINTVGLEKASTLDEFMEATKPYFKLGSDISEYYVERFERYPEELEKTKDSFLRNFEIMQNMYKNTPEKIKKANIPLRFQSSRIKDFPETVKKSCEDFSMGTSEGLFIHGEAGTGKTHLAVACMFDRMLNTLPIITLEEYYKIMMPRQGHFKPMSDLFLEIRNTFSGDTERESEVINKYSDDKANKWSFLVLDDLGVEKSSEWVQQTLYTIIDRRYRNMERTIITSNLTLSEISNKISDRIASRISEMCKVINLKGKDRRIKK